MTNKGLERMRQLMGIKPINESKLTNSSLELVKKSTSGKFYGIVKENKKYFIKESINGSDFDFIGGVGNKIKNQYNSFEEAVRRLNLMVENTDVLTSDVITEKKFVIRTKKKKEKSEEPSGDFGNEESGDEFDFGGGDTEESGDEFDFGGDKGESEEESFGDEEGDDEFDFGGDTEEGDDEFGNEETEDEDEFGGEDTEESGDEELDDEEDSIKSIQRLTGKLGQKIRDTEDISSDMSKWVAKSVISALDLDQMDPEDKKDIIRAIKKKKEDESDEEFDFMHDDSDIVNWDDLSDDEKSKLYGPGDGIGNEDEVLLDNEDEDHCSYCGDRDYQPHDEEDETYPGMESDWMSDREDYMSKYAGNVKSRLKTPGKTLDNYELESYLKTLVNKLGGRDNATIEGNEVYGNFGNIEVTPEGYSVQKAGERFPKFFNFNELGRLHSFVRDTKKEDYMDYMDYMDDDSMEMCQACEGHGTHTSIGFNRKQNSCSICGGMGYIPREEVGGEVDEPYTDSSEYTETSSRPGLKHRYQYKERFRFPFGENKKRKNIDSLNEYGEYYSNNTRMMPQPAPARPQTRPETPVKPGRPDTDKPSPSKRPFTPPPHITPGEEPNPKARNRNGYYNSNGDFHMMPQPAPARPQTRPETPVKPAKPGTDRPAPSKRPFTPPPHITPGEEPNPKAGGKRLGTRYE
jgi:hypothetical protein